MTEDGDSAAEQPAGTDEETAPDEETTPEGDADPVPDGAAVVDAVADHDETLAEDVERLREAAAGLADEVERLEAALAERDAEVDDLEDRLKRKQADFENYKKRRKREERRIRDRATEDLVERLLDVRDNLRRAVEEDHEDVEGLREGVEMTLGEFDRVLDAEDVAAIEPEPGEAVDPQRHEVMMRVDSDRPEGTVADVYEPGYEMADKVLRAAKVAVSDDG